MLEKKIHFRFYAQPIECSQIITTSNYNIHRIVLKTIFFLALKLGSAVRQLSAYKIVIIRILGHSGVASYKWDQ